MYQEIPTRCLQKRQNCETNQIWHFFGLKEHILRRYQTTTSVSSPKDNTGSTTDFYDKICGAITVFVYVQARKAPGEGQGDPGPGGGQRVPKTF